MENTRVIPPLSHHLSILIHPTGTWIPLERGLALARQYNCDVVLRPIIEFQPAAKSPPLAPKHIVASASVAKPVRRAAPSVAEPVPAVVASRSRRHPDAEDDSEPEILSEPPSEDGSMTSSPSRGSSSSRTPSPIADAFDQVDTSEDRRHGGRRKPSRRHHTNRLDDVSEDDIATQANGMDDPRAYSDQILEYFISDTNQIPQVLISPPPDFDANMAIDDDGHTALHWASAMGRLRIVKLLLTAGADIFKVNKAGQTALMRSVMFANNYDVRKFPELYELLHRSTLNIDNYNRTVFHHIVDVAMSKGKTHAARYYMESVLGRLADYPQELADVINFQDEDGETALTMAARCRSKRLVKLLIDHGADPKIVNHDGKSTEDYILEDERFRSSPGPITRHSSMSFRNAQAAYPLAVVPPPIPTGVPLHHSVSAQKASTKCVGDMAGMLDSLATSFDRELQDKERNMNQAHALLQNIQQEILESHRAVNQLKTQAEGLQLARGLLSELESQLLDKMGRRYRLGWEKWVKDEENREKSVRDAGDGELKITPMTVPYRTDDDTEVDATEPGKERDKDKNKGKRKALPQEEDITDLVALYADAPSDPDAIRGVCETVREELGHRRKRRKGLFDQLIEFQAKAGTGGRMAEYRRLIGAGCGGVPPSEVENIIGMLLEVGRARWMDTDGIIHVAFRHSRWKSRVLFRQHGLG